MEARIAKGSALLCSQTPLLYNSESKEKGLFLICVSQSELDNMSKTSRVDNKGKSTSVKIYRGVWGRKSRLLKLKPSYLFFFHYFFNYC